ncbi:MAG: hypothetical protein MZW92_81535 [Comamonadaceae bacterium]|nr:hypothetical protein [Comamonadaceae bacterium]
MDFIKRYIFPGGCLPIADRHRRSRGPGHRPAHRPPGRHRRRTMPPPCRHWRRALSAPTSIAVRALGFPDALHPHVGVLPVLLRGRLPRARPSATCRLLLTKPLCRREPPTPALG